MSVCFDLDYVFDRCQGSLVSVETARAVVEAGGCTNWTPTAVVLAQPAKLTRACGASEWTNLSAQSVRIDESERAERLNERI